ncbi:MAG TPA: membrane protein insertion efficiency factor YidD [Rhodanobacteraceae bacterium]|nr:membrane protein insertion efficiency factor YidD [Rhodanobacteraceae bacterium]
MSRSIILLLTLYQRWLSPAFGLRCRFHPSCSEYARIAVARFGAVRGGWLGLRRMLRCQPLCAGGHDPVPLALCRRALPIIRSSDWNVHD